MARWSLYNEDGSARKELVAWSSMKARCLQKAPSYSKKSASKSYAGMEIEPDWLPRVTGFQAFMDDVGPAFEGAFLDREDNSRGYVRGNVRWVTRAKSNENRSITTLYSALGKTQSLNAWASEYEISQSVLWSAVRGKGLSMEEALQSLPKRVKRESVILVTALGKTQTIAEWSLETGISKTTLNNRVVHFGWDHERAVTTPVAERKKRK